VTERRRILLPAVARHLGREVGRSAFLAFAAFLAIYVLADFFDRFDTFLQNAVPMETVALSFLFKLPLIVTQVAPMAVLSGALIGLGLLARQNEFVALRACGVSVGQVALPLLLMAGALSVAIFAWNETVVPFAAHRYHEIDKIEVRKRGQATMLTGREVWYHGLAGFYNIGRVMPKRQALAALTIYQLGPDFRPQRIIETSLAQWDGQRWQLTKPRTRDISSGEAREYEGTPEGFALPEKPADFAIASVEPEEFSYRMLRAQIESLRAKGVDASESLVDLYLKIALPAASFIMMLLAIPLAARGTRITSLPAAVGMGFAIGFAYYILIGISRALGQGLMMPPLLAAWAPNSVFALIGGYLLLGAD
jgi:lipopolysaccharide export system permease protein